MSAPRARKSVPLTAEDSHGLARLRTDHAWQRVVLELAGVELSESPSEAEALRALVEVGRTVVAERVQEERMEAGYAELAAAQTSTDRAIARATGRRVAGSPD